MERGKICVSIAGADAAAIHAEVQPVLENVDVIEIRLDSMAEPDVAKCCELFRKPLLFTNRPVREGGAFSGVEDERVRPLFAAVDLQTAYVDFELRADPQLRSQLLQAMQSSSTRMILSWHDFKSTPTTKELAEILGQMMDSGTHIGKIVTTAHTPVDVLRVLNLQEKALATGFPLSCFCMGEAGRISRLATLYLGGYMSYGALNDDSVTAPGQLSIERLYALCREFEKGNDDG
ncbi:MAG: type I 3-dehydroquinate dehydratase [Thermodesulfobacteriota bacterium]|nr:type I 3-dehydroquinate dehydratase [Thermodesulfobacteriota bacterium]